MRIVREAAELGFELNKSLGFVPTMGAFHEGHLELMRRARQACDQVVVSLFVNPLQFGEGEDFDRYPRNEAEDAAMAESVGVDVLFAPNVNEIYPYRPTTTVHVPVLGDKWEGQWRPGHFDGVATVVLKLFNLVQPNIAFFGRKDFQQCAVVKRLTRDLRLPLEISIEPTVREKDGLAMSSRNRYLSPKDRAIAPEIYARLMLSSEKIRGGEAPEIACAGAIDYLTSCGFSVDYFAYVDDETLEPLNDFSPNSSLIIAARLGGTRLIDNIQVV